MIQRVAEVSFTRIQNSQLEVTTDDQNKKQVDIYTSNSEDNTQQGPHYLITWEVNNWINQIHKT